MGTRRSLPGIYRTGVVVASVLLTATAAAAQAAPPPPRASFIEALAQFRTAIEGVYGDEGPGIEASLDRLAASLEQWERLGGRPPVPPRDAFGSAGTPFLPLALYSAGLASLARGAYGEAIAQLRASVAADPLLTDPASGAAVMAQAAGALRRGAFAEARAALGSSPLLAASAEMHRLLGAAYWAEGRDAESLEHLQAAVRLNPRDERARLALSRVLGGMSRDADAARVLEDAVAAFPASGQAAWGLAATCERLNRLPDARRAYERAARLAVSGQGAIHAAVGRLARQAADFAGALEAFSRAVEANPGDGGLRKALASVLVEHDRPADAARELAAALNLDPTDSEAHAAVGQIHLDAGRYDDAVGALRRALELSPARTQARYALATALARLGRATEATREFARVEEEQRRAIENRRRALSQEVEGTAAPAAAGAPR